MIEIYGLTKRYGDQLLFEEAAFNIKQGEHIGLAGRNGHGKTTLLKIIIGEEVADEGRVAIPKNYRIGYLHQIIDFTEKTVLREACKGLPVDMKTEIWKTEKILMGLGFKKEDFEKEPCIFSGGYQMRIELAKVLVSEPDMLLLDEPTNFLDIISIRWLENFLKTWKGELIVISHDRKFMDSVSTHIIGIHRAKVRKVKGSTKKYYSAIEKEEEIHDKRRINSGKERKQIEEYISSFRAKARRAKSVQSSIKRLNKMEKFDALKNIKTLSFSFNASPFRPPVVMETKNISFSYDESQPYLINNFSLMVERGDKICIAGPNGRGKTTLAKILAGVLEPAEGDLKSNPQVMKAYYEQGNTAKLHASSSVEDEVQASHSGKTKTEIRSICGAMMFSGDDVLKKISVLSGGERSRVLLAKTLLVPSNLLILDEPTHHLDMESCSALFEAVEEYSGAAIVITHDEYFLHKVATKLVMFMPDRIIIFPGNYSEFLEQIGWENDGGAKPTDKFSAQKPGGNKKEERKLRAEERKIHQTTIKPLETKMKKLEKKINVLENRHIELTQKLIKSSEDQNSTAIADFSKQLKDIKVKIDELYDELHRDLEEYEQIK